MPETPIHYWDACVFLDYINETKDRVDIIADLLAQAVRGEIIIVTSALSTVEVAFSYAEGEANTLDPHVESRLDALWADRKALTLIDVHQLVCGDARGLIRNAVAQGRRIKSHDAIHLATAQGRGVSEFNTYDGKLTDQADLVPFPIREPYLIEPTLGFDNG